MNELEQRALAAYFRYPVGDIINQPGDVDQVEHDGKTYVVLSNVNGILAVYRVRNDGMLKRLRRWPSGLNTVVGLPSA